MFTAIYFPHIAGLAIPDPPTEVLRLVQAADLGAAGAQLESLIETQLPSRSTSTDQATAAARIQWLADLQLVTGGEESAEAWYRRSQRLVGQSKSSTRIATCRNAGWQALFRHRLGTAHACFHRLAEDRAINGGQRFEAAFGRLCVRLQHGHLSAGGEDIHTLARLAEQAAEHTPGHRRLREVVAALRLDLATQCHLRGAPRLADHVYWQTESGGDTHAAMALAEREAATVSAPLLQSRLQYLRALRRLADGNRDAMQDATVHLRWAASQGLSQYEGAVRVEIALAALAAGAPHLAEIALARWETASRAPQGCRQLEYWYCLASIRRAQERHAEGSELYARYAAVALQCVRDQVHACNALPPALRERTMAPDDISARLPARYRRAYRYLVDNLSRADLSVREAAAHIGVTGRSLQSVFKTHLGATPTEVIRQQRMQRIRAELRNQGMWGESAVLVAASRWGIDKRSTLLSGYRQCFNETPSDTLKR